MKKWLTAVAVVAVMLGLAPIVLASASSAIPQPGLSLYSPPDTNSEPTPGSQDIRALDATSFTRTNGPAGGAMSVIKLSPLYPIDFTIFGANSFGGFYRSTDDGITWSQMNVGLDTSLDIRDIGVSAVYPRDFTIFLATSNGVYRSVDGGSTWEQKNGSGATALTNTNVRAVAVSPAFRGDRTVFVGTDGGGIFRSTDAGDTWSEYNSGLVDKAISALGISTAFAKDCAVFAGTGGTSTVYGGTGGTGVFKVDCDGTWENISEIPATGPLTNIWVTEIAVIPFYGLSGCPFRRQISADPIRYSNGECREGWMISVATAYNGIWIAMTDPEPPDASVWTWARLDSGFIPQQPFTGREAVGLAMSPDWANEPYLLAGTRTGAAAGAFSFLFTQDMSGTITSDVVPRNGWYSAASETTDQEAINQDFRSIEMAPDFLNNRALWAAPWGRLPYKGNAATLPTSGPSITWEDKANSQVNIFSYVWDVAATAMPTGATTLFAGTWGNGVHRSTDGGDSWAQVAISTTYQFVDGNSRVPAADLNDVRDVVVSPNFASDGTVFAGTFGQGILRSTAGGGNNAWQQILPRTSQGRALDPFFRALAIRSDYSGNNAGTQLVLGGTRGGGMLRSLNNGDPSTWAPINGNLSGDALSVRSIAVSPNFSTDSAVFIGTDAGIYKSNNVATAQPLQVNWTGVGNQDAGSPIVLSVAEGHADSGQLTPPPGDDFQMNGLAGFFDPSTGGGVSAKVLNIVTSIALSPSYNDQSVSVGGPETTLFAAVWGSGIYRSTDKGVTWQSLTRDNETVGSALDLTRSLALSPYYGTAGDRTIYAATFDDGIWVSWDDGNSWTQEANGSFPLVDQRDIASLAVVPAGTPAIPRQHEVFAGTAGRGVYSYLETRRPRVLVPFLSRDASQ